MFCMCSDFCTPATRVRSTHISKMFSLRTLKVFVAVTLLALVAQAIVIRSPAADNVDAGMSPDEDI
ncbi:uncharacterized protein LAESUDRAFT_811831 [Laetiporus sulphureus 93-53]|uniref:Uncharacterized protein n=1 Tax=Laetiporus sulphureus 93-53 TaxID=1314785 RepID=A0A165EZ74_9APHY|nr:uncharacterized protein LAESUDRAFT_811831 [Laetiporus sulphureus 93-53]KZT08026.1 hypothetical protein LAESUDRAFT_811831 [Laetiporus sulphureus 93-53]